MSFMRFFVFVAMVTVFCSGEFEIPDHLKAHVELLHNTCVAEIGVNENLIKESRKGNLPKDDKLACYIHCLFVKTHMIDEDHHINMKGLMEVLPTEHKELLQFVVDKCGTIHGKDGCETAYLTVKCFFEADPENSMLI